MKIKDLKIGDWVKVKIHPDYKGRLTEYNWHFINDEPFQVINESGMFKLKQEGRQMDYPFLFDSWALIIEPLLEIGTQQAITGGLVRKDISKTKFSKRRKD